MKTYFFLNFSKEKHFCMKMSLLYFDWWQIENKTENLSLYFQFLLNGWDVAACWGQLVNNLLLFQIFRTDIQLYGVVPSHQDHLSIKIIEKSSHWLKFHSKNPLFSKIWIIIKLFRIQQNVSWTRAHLDWVNYSIPW